MQSVIIIVVSTATIALLYAFMKFTFLGKALRAVSQDRETAGLMGINPNYLIMLTFILPRRSPAWAARCWRRCWCSPRSPAPP